MWNVVTRPLFDEWFLSLDESDQINVRACIQVLLEPAASTEATEQPLNAQPQVGEPDKGIGEMPAQNELEKKLFGYEPNSDQRGSSSIKFENSQEAQSKDKDESAQKPNMPILN